mgnify:FL=1
MSQVKIVTAFQFLIQFVIPFTIKAILVFLIHSISTMMYAKVLTLLAAAGFAQGNTLSDLESYTFDQFVTDFNHKFSADEHTTRKTVFDQELARVIKHNQGKVSWKETITANSHLTGKEKSDRFGRSQDVHQAHQPKHRKQLPADFKLDAVSSLPTDVDWRNTPNVVSAVKDQVKKKYV